MIYTVGHKENYEAAIKQHGQITKIGERVDYAGGIVFESQGDAERYLQETGNQDEWCVWGVDADLVMDTYSEKDSWRCYLLFDADIIPLIGIDN